MSVKKREKKQKNAKKCTPQFNGRTAFKKKRVREEDKVTAEKCINATSPQLVLVCVGVLHHQMSRGGDACVFLCVCSSGASHQVCTDGAHGFLAWLAARESRRLHVISHGLLCSRFIRVREGWKSFRYIF